MNPGSQARWRRGYALSPSFRFTGQAGFTLIELMVTVAIVGILAAIAYPSYRDYVIRGYLVDATTGLSAMRADMERYYQDNRTYANVVVGTTTLKPPCTTGTDAERTIGNFVLTCSSNLTSTAYTITATGAGPVGNFKYSIDQRNNRKTENVPPNSGYNTCTSGWMLRKGQSC